MTIKIGGDEVMNIRNVEEWFKRECFKKVEIYGQSIKKILSNESYLEIEIICNSKDTRSILQELKSLKHYVIKEILEDDEINKPIITANIKPPLFEISLLNVISIIICSFVGYMLTRLGIV